MPGGQKGYCGRGSLFVVFVENEDELGTSTRIISARAADEEEVAAYFEELMY